MDAGGWNMNWQGLNQDPAGYQNVTGYQDDPVYPKNGPSYADAVEDDQMHGMADSLATLRPEPEPDEQMIAPETMIPGHMSYEGVQYPITESSQRPSHPSESTSQTSLDDLFHDYDAEPGQTAQYRFNARDLDHVAGWNLTPPAITDDIDLSEAPGAQASQASAVKIRVQPPSQIVHPEMMGLSNRGNPPVTPHKQTIQEHLNHVITHHQKLLSSGEGVLANEDLIQTQQSLGHLMSNLDTLLQNREKVLPKNPSISTPSSAPDRAQHMFQCIQCLREGKPACIFYNTGSFKRHVNEQHYPQYEFHCPVDRCHEIRFRRSKIKDHLTNTHRQIPRPKTIDENTHERPVEPVCKLCPKSVRSWKEFYNCFLGHCLISSPPTSRRSSDDRGNAMEANGPNTHSPLAQTHANPAPPPLAPPAYGSYGNDGNYDQSLALQGATSDQGYNPIVTAPMSRSVSDDVVRGSASTNASPTRLPRHSHLPGHMISGNSLLGTLPGYRCPQLPRSALRNSASQSSGPAVPSCRGCGRFFDDCHICRVQRNSGGTCCRCHSSSSAVQVARADSSRGQIMRYINPGIGTSEPQMQTHLIPQTFAGRPMYGTQQAPQPTAPGFQGSFDSQMALHMGTPSTPSRGGRHDVFAVMEVTEPFFDEVDMAYSMRESKMSEPVGSWISSLPMGMPLVRSVIKPLKQWSNSLYGGTCVTSPANLFPERTHYSTPPSPCNCPCRTAAKLQEAYFGHARAELAPGKQLKLDLKILSPEDRGPGQHPAHLRTRVQLVVRLLKLRSSAAKTSGRKQKKEAKQAFEAALDSAFERSEEKVAEGGDDSDESDTDSIFDDDMVSLASSCSDIDALAPATPVLSCLKDEWPQSEPGYEETTALSFDFDLDSTLYTLSRWSGGLSEGLCSDLAFMDPGSVVEYFFNYIMYVMVMLSPSGGYGRGAR